MDRPESPSLAPAGPASPPCTAYSSRPQSQDSWLLDARLQSSELLATRRSRGPSVASSADCPQPASTVRRVRPDASDPYRRSRLVGFILLHTLAFCAEVFVLLNFGLTGVRLGCTGRWVCFGVTAGPFLLSGVLCSRAAMRAETGGCCGCLLPLNQWPAPLGWLLCIPLGFGQLIVVLFALDDCSRRDQPSISSILISSPAGQTPPDVKSKFHCKAVGGLLEGFVVGTVVCFAYWGMDYPEERHIICSAWTRERDALFVACCVMFLYSGLGLLELDFVVSRAIARAMRRSLGYKLLHIVYRTSEVVMRVSVYVAFMVSMREKWWWPVPLCADAVMTLVLVCVFGGAEATFFVRFLCSIPCFFANIFLFIDSPYKRRAASRLSTYLAAKNFAVTLILPALALLVGPDWDMKELRENWKGHNVAIGGSVCFIGVYWILHNCVVGSLGQKRLYTADIYSACEKGSTAVLKSALWGLTHSAAVGINLNCTDTDGNAPLMLAAAGGHANVCRSLIKEGASVRLRMFNELRPWRSYWNVAAKRRWTAVHIAARRGHVEVLHALLENQGRALHARALELTDDFRDAVGDTPLHVAARAGHGQAAAAMVRLRPMWLNVLNDGSQRPIDVARNEEVRRAMSDASAAPATDVEAPCTTPQRRPRREHGLPRHRSPLAAVDPSAELVASETEEWQEVELPIDRSSMDAQWQAPGLCSYVMSCCGGPLSRVFLANAPPHQEHIFTSTLTTIDDNSEDLNHSLTDRDHLASLQATPATGSGRDQLLGPNLEDLVPIDRNGDLIARWLLAAENRRVSQGPISSGARFTQVPIEAAEAVIGEGSYGIVWRAKDSTHKYYAVKNIRHRRNNIGVSVAAREFEVADRIRLIPHPCLVKLFRVKNFADIGLYVLVMEYCPGGDLLVQIQRTKRDYKAQQRPYQPPRAAHKWIGQVFMGLEHMHRRMNTLLRDLKPENVVLDQLGIAKLTDFGFGRFGVESTGIWSFGMPAGSPGYVAPEVLKQREYDYKADLYSLGVLTWVILTGGLVTRSDVAPPMGQRQHPTDFEAHFKDAELLLQCIHEPERNRARKMKEHPRDFVARLVSDKPEQRLNHDEIRGHRFMQVLALPRYGAPLVDVEEWLKKAAQNQESVATALSGSVKEARPAG